jgi:hypothetical protein
MSKREDRGGAFKDWPTMIEQGARSRYKKAVESLDEADDAMPTDALAGTKSELVKAIRALEVATANLNEMLAYRKMLGVD